jgi:O-antigen/teichoic acid export membrane protein
MNLKAKASSSIRWTALNTVSVTIIQFTQLAILGRLLSPAAFGLMAMLMVVIEIATVFSQMGLSEAIISKQDTNSDQLSSLYWVNVAAGFILYFLLILCSPAIAVFFGEPQLAEMLPVLALIFIISAFGIQFQALVRKHLFFDLFAKINIVSAVVSLIIAAVLAVQGFGVWALILGQLCLHISKTLALIFIAFRKSWLPGFRFEFSEINDHFYFGLKNVGAMVANQINSRIDQMAIGSLLGPVSLGFYNIAFRIALQPIQRINPILTQVAFPVFSQIQDDNARLKRGYVQIIHLLMSINAPLLIGLSAVAPIAVPLLLGEKWIPSVPVVQALCFYALFRSLGNASGSLILAKGKAGWALYWNLVLLVFIPASVILAVLIKKSVLMVSLMLVCLQIVLVFIHYFVFLRRLVGPFFKSYFTAIGKPFFAAACMGFGVFNIQSVLANLNSFLNLGISVILGFVLYIFISFYVQRELFREYWNFIPVKIQNKLVRLWNFF